MDSPRSNKENVSNSSSSLRAELLKKNQVAAPKKHKMCKDLYIKYLKEMSEFLLRLHFWVRSFGCKDWRWLRFDFDLMITKVFLAWNLFCSNFWAKYRFDKSIARSTYGKNTKWQNFYMSTIFAYLRNLFSPFITWKFGNFFEFTFCSQKIL